MSPRRSAGLAPVSLVALAALAGCDNAQPVEQAPGSPGNVLLVAIAPDGTRLWRTWGMGGWVYFAGSGASWTEGCGKNCTETVRVPTAPVP